MPVLGYLADLAICTGMIIAVRLIFGDGELRTPDAFLSYFVGMAVITMVTVYRQISEESTVEVDRRDDRYDGDDDDPDDDGYGDKR